MPRRATLALAVGVAALGPVWAIEHDFHQSKPQVAQSVTLARLASVLCPETDADEAAIHGLMDQAGITDRDIVDPGSFGGTDLLIARSFAQSFLADPKDACSTVLYGFGSGDGQLLHRAGKPI